MTVQVLTDRRGPTPMAGNVPDGSGPPRSAARSGRAERPDDLPAQLTSFVGRERELADIQALLAETRLVTLVGVGGVGKTRLALQVVGSLKTRSPNGVRLVELASLADPSLVPRVVAAAVGVRDHGSTSIGQQDESLTDRLAIALRSCKLLLVLDNCEHVLDACVTLVTRLLATCPRVRILATSREPLAVDGETAWRVPSLELPDPGISDPGVLLSYEAVGLFLDRATAASPGFRLTPENAGQVAEICRRLDGIPLAIELAAARLRGLALSQIAERLEDRFGLLGTGIRGTPPRHRTLRASIDWSYDLLAEPERRLLRRLSVFAGGWTLEAAAAVCGFAAGVGSWGLGVGDSPSPTPNSQLLTPILDRLARLVEKSLVLLEEVGGRPRYRLLETVRQYALEKLREAGEEAEVRRRHFGWFLALAERAEGDIRAGRHEHWIDRLQTELDNLRTAIAFARENREDAAGPRLVGALFWFWDHRGLWGEALEHVRWALAATSEDASGLRAKLLNAAGILAYNRGDYAQAESLAEGALSRSRACDDAWGTCFALETLGLVAEFRGEGERATELLEESLALARANGDAVNAALSLLYLSVGDQERGRLDLARIRYAESLALWRSLRSEGKVALALLGLGRVALAEGRRQEAREHLEGSLASARDAGSRRAIAWALFYLGHLSRAEGNPARAAERYLESLEERRICGDQRGVAQSLQGLAGAIAARSGSVDPATARRLARVYGFADQLRSLLGAPAMRTERVVYDPDVERLAVVLGSAFAEPWSEGQRMRLDDVIQEAAALVNGLAGRPAAPGGYSRSRVEGSQSAPSSRPGTTGLGNDHYRAGPGANILSPREREIAVLIAEGLTSRQIASALMISKRTADTHAANILNKLEFASRRQVGAWAAMHRLLDSAST